MPHLDPDRLILIALGEQTASAGEAEHLAGCPACRAELATNETVVRLGRGSHDLRELPDPPAGVWDRIAAEAFPAEASPAAAHPAAAPAATAPAPPVVLSPRRPWAPARPRNRWRLALVAVAAALVGVAGVVGVQQLGRSGSPRVIAEADLLPQAAAPGTAHGTATIVDTGHGLQMRLSLSGMPAATGYYTVWLYDGGTVMIPIGSPGSAPLNVPAAASDLTKFQVVDISAQQLGQQQHGTSMLQGRLKS
ncbi:anti-sigma factor domain-containing protein [Actinoplanes sp. CA-030573]|uniref:anti-sigma factor n=1 Tax=Actinoplanes sp. CA-030573 TaxID=3239898 RepID=UPI003D8B9D70